MIRQHFDRAFLVGPYLTLMSLAAAIVERLFLVLLIVVLRPALANAQTPELFTPVPSNQLTDATPEQIKRLEQLKQRRTTASVELVRINTHSLRGDTTRMSIPNAQPLTMSRRSIELKDNDNFIWSGTLGGIPGDATLVVHEGKVTGTIRNGADLYRIEPIGEGIHALLKVDQAHFPPEHPPGFEQRGRRGDVELRQPLGRDARTFNSPVEITVLVAYTPSAAGQVTDITATIQLAVVEANQSYQNSEINIKLSLVDSFEVSYSESGKSFDTILADFSGMADVNHRRYTSGANMAVMIINQSDYCGKADAILANASTAFAIVHYVCVTGYYSFAHELGHLQGARHDPTHDPSTTPFPYGHGVQFELIITSPDPTIPPTTMAFRTMMAYDCDSGCPRLPYWSNPNVFFYGVSMGTAATHDNARVLNETAATVAAFRGKPPSLVPVYYLLGM